VKLRTYETTVPGGQTRRVRKRELSPRMRKRIKRQRRDGVTLSIDWHLGREDEPLRVTAIHWRPGKRNALAKVIIKDCHGPLKLDLNGHEYIITPTTKTMLQPVTFDDTQEEGDK
jgi:hypothetical protein